MRTKERSFGGWLSGVSEKPLNGQFYCFVFLPEGRKTKYLGTNRELAELNWVRLGTDLMTRCEPAEQEDGITMTVWTIKQLVYSFLEANKGAKNTLLERYKTIRNKFLDNLPRYGAELVSDFDKPAFKRWVEKVRIDKRTGAPLSNRTITDYIWLVKRIFEYASELKNIGLSETNYLIIKDFQYHPVGAVSFAPPVKIKAPSADLESRWLSVMTGVWWDMATVQSLTGCRAGDIVRMRFSEIVRSDFDKDVRCIEQGYSKCDCSGCWVWFPSEYKNSDRGKDCYSYVLGAKCQAILEKYFADADRINDEFIFNKDRAVAKKKEEAFKNRKSKPTPSALRRRAVTTINPNSVYTVSRYIKKLGQFSDKAVEKGIIKQEEISILLKNGEGERVYQRKRLTSHMTRKQKISAVYENDPAGAKIIANHAAERDVTKDHYAELAELTRQAEIRLEDGLKFN